MFTYYYVDKWGFNTVTDIAYDREYDYLVSQVTNGTYTKLVIVARLFD